ncbi:MAG TPA: molybdopterin cofactor-binding domain-containing protein, partial [Candidatus Solibacter sp.]|nr:molybdopterin cofactor-binding domain-containing protein [Candidatus Solibacter sp.]
MISRRDFFKLAGGGIVVLLIADDGDAQESGGGGRRGTREAAPETIDAWLHIGEDGMVSVFTGKVEVGQNARTSLTQAVAEELHAPPVGIRMVMGDTALTPWDLGTVGSMTTPRMAPQVRKAAAAAREMLIDLAAQKWKVDRASVSIAAGKVYSGSHSANFAELTHGEKLARTIPGTLEMTPATEWKVAGTPVAKVDGRDFVTGAHKYTYDMKHQGMMWAKVLYPPQFGATLVSLDAKAAEAMPGVKVVREGDFVGVAAGDQEAAAAAVTVLKAEWTPLTAEASAKDVGAYFRKTAHDGAGNVSAANPQLTTYNIAYIAHVPLEPRAAVAEWQDGKLTVWTGSQRPFGVRSELATNFQISEDSVRVIVPDTGSGYGGKHMGDAAYEAARIAKAIGKPVKRNWTREEEMTWAYFRPGGVIDVSGKVDPDGTLTEWEMHNYNSGPSGLQTPYAVGTKKEQYHQTKSPLRQGSYRGLAATANHFVRESYMDELAHSVNLDPLEFRLKNARDERLRNVIEAAAAKFG